MLAWGAALAAALAVGIFWLGQRPTTFSTGAAQRQVVVLADGTRAELNARTTLRVRLRGTERQVWLDKGEVFLTVARDAARPFQVETAAGQVRVTGTIFNVSAPAPDSLGVLLVEGGVEATPSGGTPQRLAPGDELVLAGGRAQLRRLDAAALADALAWREGRIVFHDTPLGSALRRFAHHHARVIEVAPAVANLELGGRFVLDDLDGFLRDLPLALPVAVREDASGVIRIGPAAEGK
jgi:transmembrane sensor